MPLAVQFPAPDADRPSWVKVGVIAAVGFVVGVGWPRVMGVRLGPSAPVEASPAAPAGAPRASDSVGGALPAVTAAPAPAVPIATVAVPRPQSAAPAVVDPPPVPSSVVVGHGVVLTCRSEEGEALKGVAACGSIGGFDPVARPRLSKLGSCAAASGASGKLSAMFTLDFKTNHVGVDVGKSSTVPNPEGFGACLRASFQGVSLGPIQHDQVKYSVVYGVTFASSSTPPAAEPAASPGGSPPPPGRTVPPSAAASLTAPVEEGSAVVVWEVALVRDAPRTGQVVARLARGTKLRIGTAEDGWYKVQFGPSFGTEGYVYRGAVGK